MAKRAEATSVLRLTHEVLQQNLHAVMAAAPAPTDALSQDTFSGVPPEHPDWGIGPFVRDDSLTFRAAAGPDPLNIGWRPTSLINPSLARDGDRLVMAYRASPRKESLASRIGVATMTEHGMWEDHGIVIWPTQDNEAYGCEDPKLYRHADRWYLFYNGIFPVDPADRHRYPSPRFPIDAVGCDINLAISDDLVSWRKLGPIIGHDTSRLWAKGAAIARDPYGRPVRIDGREFWMFVSEGCGGQLMLGRSPDLLTWHFERQDFLDIGVLGGRLHEVACAIAGHNDDDLILDFLYSDADGTFAAAQARYDLSSPLRQRGLSRGGTLAWGGLVEHTDDHWLFAQGWDAPPGMPELYLYRGPSIRPRDADGTVTCGARRE